MGKGLLGEKIEVRAHHSQFDAVQDIHTEGTVLGRSLAAQRLDAD